MALMHRSLECGPTGEGFVCCCQTQLNAPHDESMKFVLLCQDEKLSGNAKIFSKCKPAGTLRDFTENGIGQGRFARTKLIGINQQKQ